MWKSLGIEGFQEKSGFLSLTCLDFICADSLLTLVLDDDPQPGFPLQFQNSPCHGPSWARIDKNSEWRLTDHLFLMTP